VVSVAGALLSVLGFFYFLSAKSEKRLIKKQVLSKESYKEFTFEIRKAFSAIYLPNSNYPEKPDENSRQVG